MLKKILIGVVILGIISFGLIGFSTVKVTEEALQQKAPVFRQYMQMTESEQDAYILAHSKELIADAMKNSKPEEKADAELIDKTKDDPIMQQAIIKLGRSLMALGIMHTDIVKDMTADVKAKYQKESDELTIHMETYGKLLESARATLDAK
ncbi:MAG: hypothetical protein IJS69_02955 [Selenomonadaceae bacterium]|nr:hypothetical protein [Selenomonadaceae bacterium]